MYLLEGLRWLVEVAAKARDKVRRSELGSNEGESEGARAAGEAQVIDILHLERKENGTRLRLHFCNIIRRGRRTDERPGAKDKAGLGTGGQGWKGGNMMVGRCEGSDVTKEARVRLRMFKKQEHGAYGRGDGASPGWGLPGDGTSVGEREN